MIAQIKVKSWELYQTNANACGFRRLRSDDSIIGGVKLVKLDVKYSTVIDGENVVLEGIQNLPSEIEKDLVKRGFAKELSENDVAPKIWKKQEQYF